MRKLLMLTLIAGTAFFVGCGKKSKKVEKVAKSEVKSVIPVYPAEADEFFDAKEVNDYAFVEDDKKVEDNVGQPVEAAESVELANSDWDDEGKVSLALDDDEYNDNFDVINFDFNRNEIRKDQVEKVAKNAKFAETVVKTGKEIVVTGHACPMGSDSYNLSLSEKRALAVKNEMEKLGVDAGKIKVLGCGSQKPIVLSQAEGREERIRELAPNRRAQVSVN